MERRNQLTHPPYAKPELLAERPNELWSWDVSKLKGPAKWTYYYLYVILDVFSRYAVGWTVQYRENGQLAKALIEQTTEQQQIAPILTLHADRGAPQRAKPVAFLLADLGVTKTHSRPYTSQRQPLLGVELQDPEVPAEFPARFDSIEHARAHCRQFFHWYNHEHRHSGIGLMTPATFHHGQAQQLYDQRAAVLVEAYARNPERFVRKPPAPPELHRPPPGSTGPRRSPPLTKFDKQRRLTGLDRLRRSKWAWIESFEPVSVVACGAGERARPEARFGRGSLLGSVSSTKRLVRLMAAGVLLIGAAPASALAGSASGLAHQTPDQAHTKQQSIRVPHAGSVMLALGRGYSTVSGDAGVRALQRRLANAGYAPGPIDGRYGPRTEQAVSGFQAARGLGVDGIAGALTLAALRKPSAVVYPGTGYAGNGSGRVRVLQRRLAKAGFAPGPIDGRYGPRTEQAVSRFQTAHGLGVDGIAGPLTLARLRNQQPTSRRRTVRPSGPVGSHQRANRRPHRQRSRAHTAHRQPGRAPAPGRLLPANHSTSSQSPGLLVLLIALAVALGLSAIWIARRRRAKRSVGISAPTSGSRSAPADTAPADPNPTTTPNAAAILIPDLGQADDADRVFRQALGLEECGDQMGAMAAYRQADQLGHGLAACNLGALLAQRGEMAAAEASFRRAAERGDVHGAFNLAVLHEERGDLTGAIAAYQQADRLGHGGAACNLGVLLEQHGDLAAAEAAFRRAAERGEAAGAFNLGTLLAQRGEMAAAEASFRRAAERGEAAGAFNLAVLHEERGDLTGAIAAYQQADRLGDGGAACNLGVLLEQHGDLAAAEAAFRRAAERGEASGALNLGALLEGQGDRKGALRAYEQAERLEHATGTADKARAAARVS